MKKTIILIAVICMIAQAAAVFAQTSTTVPENIGVDTAQQKLKEVSVTKFEDPGFWTARIPSDQGIISLRRFEGAPSDKKPIPDEDKSGITEQDKYVLATKVEYFKRDMTVFSVLPVKPIPVEGITKTISLWVVGRNVNHVLKLLVEDQFGGKAELTVGKLNFSGWKQLSVAIPPTLKQRDHHYVNKMGIKIAGIKIECDPRETIGSYYIYFDDMRAVTDLFGEESRDVDDMADGW
jgi:hypothetical protein